MADVVAITAIGVSGAVSLGSAAITARWSTLRQREDFARQSLEELRALLEDGADALSSGKRSYHLYREQVPCEERRAQEAFANRGEAMLRARHVEARIAIRLGQEHEVFKAYRSCLKALSQMSDFAHAYERQESMEGPLAEQMAGHDAYYPARTAYIDEAKAAVDDRAKKLSS